MQEIKMPKLHKCGGGDHEMGYQALPVAPERRIPIPHYVPVRKTRVKIPKGVRKNLGYR